MRIIFLSIISVTGVASFFFSFLFAPAISSASIEIGAGLSNATSGRVIPGISLSYSASDWALSGFSTGVQSEVAYQSTFAGSYFRTWKAGDFAGVVTAGFGAGGFYTKRGFKDGALAQEESSDDWGFGPSFRVNWSPTEMLFLNVEGIYGLKVLGPHLAFNFQDLVNFTLGVRF